MTASFVRHRSLYDVCSGVKMLIEISVFIVPSSRWDNIDSAADTKCGA